MAVPGRAHDEKIGVDPTVVATAIPYTLFSKNERRAIVVLIALAGWFSTLSSFIYYPAISIIASDLDTTVALINLTVTSYMIVSGIAPSVVGDASDTFGRRPLYMLTRTLYIAANIGIALQQSFVALFFLRMLQSAGISGTLVLCSCETMHGAKAVI
jgi:MFS family permease